MDGITDAIQAAEDWLIFARAHRDRPETLHIRVLTTENIGYLIAKLQRLGPVGEKG